MLYEGVVAFLMMMGRVTYTNLGEAVGISKQAATDQYRKIYGKGGRVSVTVSQFVLDYCARLRKEAGGRTEEALESKLDRNQMAARKDAAHAEKLEMENSVRRGELVEAEEVRLAWVQICSNIRASLMSLPSRVAKELSAMEDPREIQIRLDEEVRDTLTSLAE